MDDPEGTKLSETGQSQKDKHYDSTRTKDLEKSGSETAEWWLPGGAGVGDGGIGSC